jgi:hypothetical protein
MPATRLPPPSAAPSFHPFVAGRRCAASFFGRSDGYVRKLAVAVSSRRLIEAKGRHVEPAPSTRRSERLPKSAATGSGRRRCCRAITVPRPVTRRWQTGCSTHNEVQERVGRVERETYCWFRDQESNVRGEEKTRRTKTRLDAVAG